MVGLGTIINALAIIVGGVCGLIFGKKIKSQMREGIMVTSGIAVMVMAGVGIISKALVFNSLNKDTMGTLMMICSLCIGVVIGEAIGIHELITRFGEYLKKKSGSDGDASFVGAFVLASCTVCIGAMAIMGAIEDGVNANHSILIAKALLDAIIICIMTASNGKGCIFSAIPVALFQGLVTLIAFFAGGFMSDMSLNCLSYVGNVLILCVGINLAFDKNIRVANILPAVVVAAIWGCFI